MWQLDGTKNIFLFVISAAIGASTVYVLLCVNCALYSLTAMYSTLLTLKNITTMKIVNSGKFKSLVQSLKYSGSLYSSTVPTYLRDT